LRPDEIILYPVVLPDRVELLYLRGGGDGRFHRLPPKTAYDREKVAALVNVMRFSIVQQSEEWRAPSRELYDLLISPFESQLRSTGTLVVIPDATLSALPFAALTDSHDRYLIQKTRIDIAPGLAYAQPGAIRGGRKAFVVAASLDRDVKLPFGSFEKLRNFESEARFAAGMDGDGAVRRGIYIKDFTRASLISTLKARQVDVLHLATHASFNGGTDKSFIVANGDFISLTDLRQIISTNRAFGNDLDLLVLSACETAVGDDKSSLGLAGAAVQSGARGAIASLWPVDDDSGAQLMHGFYDSYRRGAAKAEAMQASEVAMLQTPRYRAPFYWASMILVGGWR